MRTLADFLMVLKRMGIEAEEIELSGDAYDYLMREAEKIIAAEEEEEEEW